MSRPLIVAILFRLPSSTLLHFAVHGRTMRWRGRAAPAAACPWIPIARSGTHSRFDPRRLRCRDGMRGATPSGKIGSCVSFKNRPLSPPVQNSEPLVAPIERGACTVALVALRHRAFSDNASGVLRRGAIATVAVGLGPRATGVTHSVATLHVVRSYAVVSCACRRCSAGGSRLERKPTCVRRLAKMPSGTCLKASNGGNALREIERKERARVTCSIGRELGYGRYRCRQRELSSPAWCPLPSLRAMP